MKTFIATLFLLCFSLTGFSATMTGSPATVTNAVATSVKQKVSRASQSVTIQFVLTKTSGTIAGKATVQGSLDDVNYVNLDSLTLSNVTTNTKISTFSGNPYLYYRVLVVGSGTMAGTLNGYILTNSLGGTASASVLKSTYNLALDTVTNTGTKTLTGRITLPYKTVSVGITVTKVSGTLAGTVTLQGSIDGVNYATVPTAYIETVTSQAPYTVTGAATFTVPDYSAPTKIFTINGSRFIYYRLSYTGSGTMVGTIKGYLFTTN